MRNVTSLCSLVAALALAFTLVSCNSTANPGAVAFNATTGNHPANWATTHAAAYTANPAQCTPCHGSSTVQPTTAPKSGVTCFGCHHPNGPAGTQPNWDIAHAAAYATNGAQCVQCHGSATTAPTTTPSSGFTCFRCHHPNGPANAPNDTPSWDLGHSAEFLANPNECVPCHGSATTAPTTPTTSGLTCFGCHHTGGPTAASATPAAWDLTHWQTYSQNPTTCVTCHGGVTTPPVTAPTSGLTCFNCHHPDGPAHSSDWGGKSSAQPIPPHGAAAILAAGAPFNLASPVFPDPLSGLTGMASCVPCHGPLYNGTDLTGTIPNNTAAGGAPSCYACHTTAPHPPAPWGAGLGLPATQPNHDQVDPSNASECVKCHALGANTNPAITPVVPAPAGTAPGCFNGTLCHSKSLS